MTDAPSWLLETAPEQPTQSAGVPSWLLETAPQEEQEEPYSARELYKFAPEFRNYYSTLHGRDTSDLSDEEVADQFLKRRRLVLSNTPYAADEIFKLTAKMDDEEAMAAVGGAYVAFEGMEDLFGGEGVTLGEKAGGVATYIVGTIADPSVVLGGILGKFAGRAGSKVALKAAERMAQEAFRRKIAQGATEKVAMKHMATVYGRQAQKATTKAIAESGTQNVAKAWQNVATRSGLKEVGAVTAVDVFTNVGIELGYQQGLRFTGLQDEYDSTTLGITALGTAFLGSVAAGSVMRSSRKTFSLAENPNLIEDVTSHYKTQRQDSGKREGIEAWEEKWTRGKRIEELGPNFWKTVILGDEEIGFQGLHSVLKQNGYMFKPRYPGEPVSNQIADFFTKMGDEKHQELLKFFQEEMGIVMDKSPKQNAKEFSDTFARTIRDAMQLGNATSQVARSRGITEDKVTNDMILEHLLGEKRTPYLENLMKESNFNRGTFAELNREFLRFQNNSIRTLVGSLATTAVNIGGWSSAEAIQTLVDVGTAGMHGGVGAMLKIAGAESADEQLRIAKQIGGNLRQKYMNLIDMGTTIEQFRSFQRLFPDEMAELTYVLPGGVENVTELKKAMRKINPVETPFGRGVQWVGDKFESLANVIHTLTMVDAQDVYTKAFTFMGQLDKEFRLGFNKPLNKYLDDPIGLNLLTNQKEFSEILRKASETTQEMIFSKPYANRGKHSGVSGTIFKLAEIIEDARNWHGIGMLVPFGQFFNNTIAFSANNTGIGILAKYMSRGAINKNKSYEELFMRALVTAGVISSLVPGEVENIEKGHGIFDVEMNGTIVDTRTLFPLPIYKSLAHIAARKAKGEGLTSEDMEQMTQMGAMWTSMSAAWKNGDDFDSWLKAFGKDRLPENMSQEVFRTVYGQLTRELVGSADGAWSMLDDALNGRVNPSDFASAFVGTAIGTYGSAWSRFYEPVDLLLGQIKAEDYSAIDRKQLDSFFAEATRYIPFTYELLSGKALPKKQSASRGEVPASSLGKFIGVRQLPPQTNIEKILNALGREHYLLSEYSNSVPEYASRFSSLFFSMSEERAGQLWNLKSFRQATLQEKEQIWDTEVTRIHRNVKSVMRAKLVEAEDRRLVVSFDLINQYGADDVQEAMRILNIEDVELNGLNIPQLNQIDLLLKSRNSLSRRRLTE